MSASSSTSLLFPRLLTSGKWLREGEDKWSLRGVSYGPFKPNAQGEPFPEEARLIADLEAIQRMGFNTVRLYELPTDGMLRAATERGLRLLVGIPWTDHVDFLRDRSRVKEIRQQIEDAVKRFKEVPCVAGFLVGNEIEKTLVRWMGPSRVRAFLEGLIKLGRDLAPEKLFSYATYPSTEYLIPRNADFLAVNLYLEQPESLAAYLQRLQNLAGNKPLIITEFGLDVAAHNEAAQAATRQWFHSLCHQYAVAGTVWFSFTDEWFRGGEEVTTWKFGLVDAERREREAAGRQQCSGFSVQSAHESALKTDDCLLNTALRMSVIVCTYNGTATLRACLESLGKLRYADFEVLLIDDGSTQDIARIAQDFPQVRYVRQEHAGLSVARNLGASLATGEILAYTDDDCIVDEDWLDYLLLGFDDPQWVAAGGPNIPPQPRNRTEAVVAAAPGAPAHVLLTDTEAEHLPGCNLAIRKTALEAIGGFQPQYAVAGDDVDVCWRLREAGGKLRFVPGAMVWHHRRYTVGAYLRQQRGYGRAEALLMRDHPERFGPLGGARWLGGIYGDRATNLPLDEGTIFHGPLGEGLFQGIYRQGPRCWLDWMSGVLWVALALTALLLQCPFTAAIILSFSLLLAACRLVHLTQAPFSLSLKESFLLLGLCWLQPVAREWARVTSMIQHRAHPSRRQHFHQSAIPARPRKVSIPLGELTYWSEEGKGRGDLLESLQTRLRHQRIPIRIDDGWRLFDLESEPQKNLSTGYLSVTEYHNRKNCSTRFRLILRVRYAAIAGTGFMLLLLASWLSLPSPMPWMASVGLTYIALALIILTWLYKRRAVRLVQASAIEAGLREMESSIKGT